MHLFWKLTEFFYLCRSICWEKTWVLLLFIWNFSVLWFFHDFSMKKILIEIEFSLLYFLTWIYFKRYVLIATFSFPFFIQKSLPHFWSITFTRIFFCNQLYESKKSTFSTDRSHEMWKISMTRIHHSFLSFYFFLNAKHIARFSKRTKYCFTANTNRKKMAIVEWNSFFSFFEMKIRYMCIKGKGWKREIFCIQTQIYCTLTNNEIYCEIGYTRVLVFALNIFDTNFNCEWKKDIFIHFSRKREGLSTKINVKNV